MCKSKALEMAASNNPPRKDDGKKRRYIEGGGHGDLRYCGVDVLLMR